jgi:adenylosuccinate lyase
MVQRNAMQSWKTGEDFRSLLAADAEVATHLSRAELDACFDLQHHLRNMGEVFARLERLEL